MTPCARKVRRIIWALLKERASTTILPPDMLKVRSPHDSLATSLIRFNSKMTSSESDPSTRKPSRRSFCGCASVLRRFAGGGVSVGGTAGPGAVPPSAFAGVLVVAWSWAGLG